MPNKCESCKWLIAGSEGFSSGQCAQPELLQQTINAGVAIFNISRARNICDREGDGHFVYFEPKTPTAGAAFASGTSTSTPTTPEMALKAAA